MWFMSKVSFLLFYSSAATLTLGPIDLKHSPVVQFKFEMTKILSDGGFDENDPSAQHFSTEMPTALH